MKMIQRNESVGYMADLLAFLASDPILFVIISMLLSPIVCLASAIVEEDIPEE